MRAFDRLLYKCSRFVYFSLRRQINVFEDIGIVSMLFDERNILIYRKWIGHKVHIFACCKDLFHVRYFAGDTDEMIQISLHKRSSKTLQSGCIQIQIRDTIEFIQFLVGQSCKVNNIFQTMRLYKLFDDRRLSSHSDKEKLVVVLVVRSNLKESHNIFTFLFRSDVQDDLLSSYAMMLFK